MRNKVEELERELFKIQEENKAKQDSDEDLEIEDDDDTGVGAQGRLSSLPDIRISTKTKRPK